MNFLQLVRRTMSECGVPGGLNSVASATGETARVVEWVRTAYINIQNERRWNWLWRQATANLLAGRHTFNPATEWDAFALQWDEDTARLGDYHLWMREYSGPVRQLPEPTRPSQVTIYPDRTLVFNAVLDHEYQFTCDYYSSAEVLREDTDTPSMPEQYHDGIVWAATMLYADLEEAGTLRMTAQLKLDLVRAQMLHTEVPIMKMRALA